MKKLFSLSALMFAALMPVIAETPCFTGYDRLTLYNGDPGHLYYNFNTCTNASVAPRKSGTYYKPLVIPVNTVYEQTVISEHETPVTNKILIPVVEIETAALLGATSASLTFEAPSNLRIIRKQGISKMTGLSGTLELPEGLELIETEGVSELGSAGSPLTKLVIPSTIDSLSLSAILLDGLTTIEFKGATPPRCAVAGSLTPFNSESLSTPADITIIVPEGAFEAYSDAPGIGDYFACFPKMLTVSSNGNGSVATDKPRYYIGETATITVRPAEHYHFVAWKGEDNAAIKQIDDTHFTYVMGSAFRNFSAIFAEDTSTAIEAVRDNTTDHNTTARKFLHNGRLLILTPEGSILNASGAIVTP